MSILAYILLSFTTLLFSLGAYLWYVTPSPQDLAEEVLRHSKRKRAAVIHFATRPRPDFTHINCLS